MSKVVAQTHTLSLRRMELVSTELQLLKAEIVQLHDRFDLLLAEITEMQHEYHAANGAIAAGRQPEKDHEKFAHSKFIEPSEHKKLSANAAPLREPRSLTECLAQVRGDEPTPAAMCLLTFPSGVSTDDSNSTSEDALGASEPIIERSQTRMAMASPLDVPSTPQLFDATGVTAASSARSNHPRLIREYLPSHIPPPDIMASQARRERPMSRWRFFARRAGGLQCW